MEKLDCACVIHGDMYGFEYVENLYNMLVKHLPVDFRFHVFTESHRTIPPNMIKHPLEPWHGVAGKRSAWWYKMQMFAPKAGLNQTLYLDLDVVIANDLSWITKLDTRFFWSIRDFKYLWRPNHRGINSSMMYWHQSEYSNIWKVFEQQGVDSVRRQWHGDQDFLSSVIDKSRLKFIEPHRAQSWRWQVWEGGIDIKTRHPNRPGSGVHILPETSLVIFHGTPKPHQLDIDWVVQHWNHTHMVNTSGDKK
jgi:hypothetical protein